MSYSKVIVFPLLVLLVVAFKSPLKLHTMTWEGSKSLTFTLSVISSFKLSNRPDQIFKQKKNLWSAISSTKQLYKHKLDDKLSIVQAYKIKDLPGDSPLSSFSWKDGKLWVVRDGIKEITQMGIRYLKTDD